MVRVEKMVMEGFKSFKRKVSVPFVSGFSVVTGPNGSGKTNIADAIYFVLGSGTSKSLRAKKAHELIFQGNQKRKASDYAKVVMHFDNKDRLLPVENDSVTVSRRVNKAGVSTYRLSGKVSTKQEVLDILALAGITTQGHNLIQQGDITRIVQMGPIERRKIIDEIAGITEYDEKKDKALKEMGKVEEKVREAEIVLEQKDDLLTKIKNERDAAVEFQKLQNTLKLIAASAILKNLRLLEKRLEGSGKGANEKDDEVKDLSKDIAKHEKEIDELEKKAEGITKKVLNASSKMEEAGKINDLQTRISMKKERIKMNEREVARLNELIDRLSTLDKRESQAVKAVLDREGVMGTFSDLVMVPPKYKVPVEVAAGGHLGDVIVERHLQAAECIKYLKSNKVGRARFLPIDKITPRPIQDLPTGAIGWLSELVQHDHKYQGIVNYILGSTMCVNDIERARELMGEKNRHRMVTLDGDLIEKSGAMTGGFYKKKGSGANLTQYLDNRKELDEETDTLRNDLEQMEEEYKSLKGSGEKIDNITKLEEERIEITRQLEELRDKRDECYEKRMNMQEEAGKINVRQARYEANLDSVRLDWEKYRDMEDEIKKSGLLGEALSVLEEKKNTIVERMDGIGPVNLKAIEEFEKFKEEFEDFKVKVDKVIEEKNSIEKTIHDIEKKKREVFVITMEKISTHFKKIYNEMTSGEAALELDSIGDVDSGLLVYASPPGKKLLNIDAMSTGEKTLTAFAFLFAIQNYKPAPFYVLDEADAALDKTNTSMLSSLVKKHSDLAQFIIISHNDQMIKEADQVYGVSMENGESKVIGIKLPNN